MNAKFMADAEQEAEEERTAHAVFDTEQQHRREAAATEEESDNDDNFDWSGLDPEEKATEQRALVSSFETLKRPRMTQTRRCGSGYWRTRRPTEL
jgi:hypothetical protein